MILAAGRGVRLRPITDEMPKAMVAVGGKPLIDHALAVVARAGIHDVIINLHHRGEVIERHVGDGTRFGLRVIYSREDPLLGSGGGIVHARPLIGESTFVTLNADTIIDIDLRDVLAYHRTKAAVATLVLRKDPRMEEFGLLRIDRNGRLVQFLKARAPETHERGEAFMYSGVQILEPHVFDYMPAGKAFSVSEITYPRMLQQGERVFGFPFEGLWITVGTPEELSAARRRLRT